MNLLSDLLTIYIPFLIIIWFFFRKNNKLGFHLLYISVTTVIISLILKELFKTGINEIPQGFQLSKYRFPSLSTQLAITFWLYLSLKYKKIILFGTASLIVIFVAYQKLISNQHSLLDIFGGLIIGLLVIFVFIYFERKEKNKWGRLAIIERFPDPLTPMTQDVIIEVYTYSVREALKELKLESKKFIPTYKIFNGYIYNNFDLKKIPKLKLLKLFTKLYSKARKTEQRYYQEILPDDKIYFEKFANINLKESPQEKLWQIFENIEEQFKKRMTYETVVTYFLEAVMKILKPLMKLIFGRESKNYPYLQSIVYQGENESIKVDKEIGDLVADIKRLNLTDSFTRKESKETLSSLKVDENGLKFYQKFENFVDKYRFRFTNYDFIASTWEESPELIIEIIKNYLIGNIDIRHRTEAEKEKKKETLLKIEGIFRKSTTKRILFKNNFYKWLNLAEKYNLLKEARYNSRMMYFFWLKKILLQIGENLVNAGIIEKGNDIFFVHKQELESLLVRKTDLTEIKFKIDQRKKEKEKQSQLNPPFEFTEQENVNWTIKPESQKELTGIIANTGQIRGTCKIITNTNDFCKLKKGDILVARTTNPAWTPLFAVAGGVITEVGGLLSHAAIVSREYGIPSLINVKNATQILRDGDLIEVDANNGIIKKLD